jgi:hypothetical protein
MDKDESQTQNAQGINVKKELPQHVKDRSAGWETLRRIKTKEAERLFNQYCYPGTWFWEYWEWKQAALAILDCGIFEGSTLKGAEKTRTTYPVELGDLIFDLVQAHFDYDINLPPFLRFHRLEGPLEKEIVDEFDEHFRFVAAIARQAGIKKDRIKNIGDAWRDKIYSRAIEGKIPHHWRYLVMNEISPGVYVRKKIAFTFADAFLRHGPYGGPHAPYDVPTDRIVKWVNVTLESLGRPPAGKTTLTNYINAHKSPPTPIQITE